ncbi:peptide ABC transporter substrate-binding protein [Oscillospiraceae bacterium]|nr:peptide ABC transporter substrate-binding protein [Oscillospiraceae bacterium]
MKLKAISAALLAALMFTACAPPAAPTDSTPAGSPSSTTAQPAGEKVVTMAISSTWETLMPFNTSSNYGDVIFDQLYDRLVFNRGDNTFEPRLASGWEVGEDAKSITFAIDPNAKWHDGQPVTAEDVAFTAQLVSDPAINSSKRSFLNYFEGVDDSGAELSADSIGVEVLEGNKVRFNLKRPMDPEIILGVFNKNFFVLPKHILEDKTVEEVNGPDLWEAPIGSGPFKFGSSIAGEEIQLDCNESYHLGKPDFDKLVIRVTQSANLVAGLMSGDIDILAGSGLAAIPLEDWETAQAQENLNCVSIENYSYQYMVYNTQREYMTAEVRRAIDMAINRSTIVDQLLKGEGQILATPWGPNHPYCNKEVYPPEYDPETAKQMLADAGWDTGRELLMMVPTGNKVRERSAVLIQQDLEKVGVKIKLQSVDFPTLMSSMQNGETDFGLVGASPAADPDDHKPALEPGSSTNFSLLTDPTLYELMKKGLEATSFEACKAIYDEEQVKFREICNLSMLYSPNTLFAYNKRIQNVQPTDSNFLNWATWEWKVD